jgi:hypothetical protein
MQPLVLGPLVAECDDRLPQLSTERVVSHRFADTLSPAEFVVNHLADKRAMPTLLNLPLHGHVPGTITRVGEALKPIVSA